MKMKDLLKGIHYEVIQGTDEINVPNISWDSRSLKPNSLFICVKNKNIDRHDYAHEAINVGATALLIEHKIENIPNSVNVIKVKNTKLAMAIIASRFYDEPSKKLNLIGITGTNGKTTVTFFITKILECIGRKVGIISTIENRIGNTPLITAKLNPTTPDSIELQSSFAEMIENNVTDAVMEVTSIALEQHRTYMCDFDIGIFTNLTQDHLDDHGTMENYKNAKMKLFKMCRFGIINADDPVSQDIIQNSTCEIITYGINTAADFMAKDIKYSQEGVSFTLNFCDNHKKVKLNVPGEFNVYNALSAIASCYFLGFPLHIIIAALTNINGVKGRFEVVPNDNGYLVIVDYAHTPDSLKNILTTFGDVKEQVQSNLIVVFGCGGERDRTKRPIMGEVAGNFADYCVLTCDNPRKEDPIRIIEEIEEGIERTSCPYEKIEDRKVAIHTALKKANPSDVVIIAGKGHENYQILKDKVIHFDDVEVVMEYFSLHSLY
ncbi:UDP-N-acetylmuramoyl-L-alanyl-D-glutamate--2,6-diaminopimelate ligase [Clostridium estertheticum]|uniref:UDP-N-acetylmuramoyl-L-alanyl-D-glutamate--2, 6-diaminopimelate ligase n=1 Tax=Clostridium estertheticum TaxID=238834 RepID=UPI0013E9038D|nr:UDP-N-acetylmuramoyl-L-alanyl-D-glutamate--2,6-diaminopimelate ligase [Clostridium estertheticum]MBZ9687237.1 UDP-N-acetylmuramoyl-L-alanyl-D-glutamate--2,6-diaminopimelate ligase [Clostridium estertheticum]